MKKITKAIIPVAGLGTRMLPATKAIPKELLPIMDKPVIQYVVEEAVLSGIKQIIFVTRSGKEAIENHFDGNYELEHILETKGKKRILGSIKNMIPKNIKISSIRQEKALGLGDAILNAKHLLNQEPFAIFLPDELLISRNKDSSFYKMMNHWDNTNQGQIMVQKINKKFSKSYGIVDLNNKKIKINETQEINRLVEKPNPVDSPSNYRVVGRYILPYEIMEMLESTNLGKDNEIQLTDALDNLLKNTKLRAFLTDDDIYDCGEIKGFIGANVAIASKDRDLKRYMEDIIN